MLPEVKEKENNIYKLLDVKVLKVEGGESEIEFPLKMELTRRGGVLNGGIITTALDLAGGLAVSSVNDGVDQVTQELKVNFLEPMFKGPFKCKAKVMRKGRTAVVVVGELFDVEGKLGAVSLGTWYIIRDRKISSTG